MNTVKNLVLQAKESLENNTNIVGLVGNRMHYPMLIYMNGNNTDIANDVFTEAFKKMWPQTHEHIVFVQNNENLSTFTNKKTDSVMDVNSLQNQLDEVRSSRGVFESLLKWCLYNIIDTTTLDDLNSFIKQYESINTMKNVVIDNTASMAVVLLDETASKRELAKQIREYLYANTLYDGTVIISNKTISNELYSIDEILPIVSGVLVLTNNDAITHDDDDNYNERYNCFYSGNRLTIAHSLLERPNEKIAIQIINQVLDSAENITIRKTQPLTSERLRNLIGLDRGFIEELETQLNNIEINFDINEIMYFPFSKVPNFGESINSITYVEFSKFIFENSFNEYVSKYCNEQIISRKIISDLLNLYKSNTRKKFNSQECLELNSETIGSLMNMFDFKEPNKALTLKEYFVNYVKFYIRKNVIHPFIEEMLYEFKEKSKDTIETFYEFENEFKAIIPIEGYADLGTVYSTIADNYSSSTYGEDKIRSLLSPGNSDLDIANILRDIFVDILQKNTEKFSLSFIEEWEQRLNLAGDEVFNKIQTTFNSDFNKRRFLFGNFQVDKKLEIYLIHTTDANGNNPTGLFNHLKRAFLGTDHIQFINTGYDDRVEAFQLIDCSGSKIVL